MKLRSATVGIFLIGMMFFSTFAYVIIQSFSYKTGSSEPLKSNVINYYMEPNLRTAYLQSGATIISLQYSDKCVDCLNMKYDLEYLANTYSQQIILEEVSNQNVDKPTTTVSSAFGERTVIGSNSTELLSALCSLMVYPPAQCAVSNLSK